MSRYNFKITEEKWQKKWNDNHEFKTTIDKNKILIFRINEADQNYEYFKKFVSKLGLELNINKKKFLNPKNQHQIKYQTFSSYSWIN